MRNSLHNIGALLLGIAIFSAFGVLFYAAAMIIIDGHMPIFVRIGASILILGILGGIVFNLTGDKLHE